MKAKVKSLTPRDGIGLSIQVLKSMKAAKKPKKSPRHLVGMYKEEPIFVERVLLTASEAASKFKPKVIGHSVSLRTPEKKPSKNHVWRHTYKSQPVTKDKVIGQAVSMWSPTKKQKIYWAILDENEMVDDLLESRKLAYQVKKNRKATNLRVAKLTEIK